MKTKKQNRSIDKRVVRRREKRAVRNGLESSKDKAMGRVCQRGWRSNIVATRTNDLD